MALGNNQTCANCLSGKDWAPCYEKKHGTPSVHLPTTSDTMHSHQPSSDKCQANEWCQANFAPINKHKCKHPLVITMAINQGNQPLVINLAPINKPSVLHMLSSISDDDLTETFTSKLDEIFHQSLEEV